MVERMPNQAQAMGLITLMHLHDARRNASTDLNGALAVQNSSRNCGRS